MSWKTPFVVCFPLCVFVCDYMLNQWLTHWMKVQLSEVIPEGLFHLTLAVITFAESWPILLVYLSSVRKSLQIMDLCFLPSYASFSRGCWYRACNLHIVLLVQHCQFITLFPTICSPTIASPVCASCLALLTQIPICLCVRV